MKIELEVVSDLLYKKIDELLELNFFRDKNVILFGFNSTSHCIEEYLKEKGYLIYAYIDNNKRCVKDRKNVFFPEDLLKEYIEEVVILIASKYYSEMEKQLQKLGYRTGKHIIKVVDYYGIDSLLKQKSKIEQAKLSNEEIRILQIDILKYVKEVCNKNGLRYYLAAGTMLGAVRHQGFIPWDDDVDLLMPLKDCKQLMNILEEDKRYYPLDIYHQPEQCYKFYYRVVDSQSYLKTWDYPFLTTAGISIDIFPLSGIPGNEEERFAYTNRIAELKTNYLTTYMAWNKNSMEMQERRENIKEEIIYMIEKYDFDESLYVGNSVSKYREKETIPKEIFDSTIEVLFEKEKYLIPKQYDVYLKSLYGNYMELPPEKERETTHNYRAYMR